MTVNQLVISVFYLCSSQLSLYFFSPMKFLRTEYAALVGMILILLATVKHAFEVYLMVMYPTSSPSLWQMVYIAVMLIAIDFAVLIFTIHGNSYAAQTFAFLIFLVNLFAFWHHIPWPGWNPNAFCYIPGLLFSGMFAYGLYYFTDVFSDLLQTRSITGGWKEKYQEAQGEIADLQNKIDTLETEKNQLAKAAQNQVFSSVGEMEISPDIQEKLENYDLLLRYLLEVEGFDQKSPQAVRKGVEYWRRKRQSEELDYKGIVKQKLYEAAFIFAT
jgi:hypothetical protein